MKSPSFKATYIHIVMFIYYLSWGLVNINLKARAYVHGLFFVRWCVQVVSLTSKH